MLVYLPQQQRRKDPQKNALETNYVHHGALVSLLTAASARIVSDRNVSSGSVAVIVAEIARLAALGSKRPLLYLGFQNLVAIRAAKASIVTIAINLCAFLFSVTKPEIAAPKTAACPYLPSCHIASSDNKLPSIMTVNAAKK